jgi:hypothetical protein
MVVSGLPDIAIDKLLGKLKDRLQATQFSLRNIIYFINGRHIRSSWLSSKKPSCMLHNYAFWPPEVL